MMAWNKVTDFQFISDIHLEFYPPDSPHKWPVIPRLSPILILAGDVGRVNQSHYRMFLQGLCKGFEHVLLVPGNHEYYQAAKPTHTLSEIDQLLEKLNIANLHVLQKNTIVINGIRFAGATMWTDPPDDSTHTIEYSINDYHLIKMTKGDDSDVTNRNWKKMNVNYSKNIHRDHISFLKEVIRTSVEPLVIITHHCPTKTHIHPKYQSEDLLNFAYYTDIPSKHPSLLAKPLIGWICGHSHHCMNYSADFDGNSVLFLMNAMGYRHENIDGFDPCRVVTVFKHSLTNQFKLEENVTNLDTL